MGSAVRTGVNPVLFVFGRGDVDRLSVTDSFPRTQRSIKGPALSHDETPGVLTNPE